MMARKNGTEPLSQPRDGKREAVRGANGKKSQENGARWAETVRSQDRSTDVDHLPGGLHKVVDGMLIKGSKFQDIVEAVNGTGIATISLAAIELYFRSNVKLQQERVKFHMKTAHDLTRSCMDPKSAQSNLAEALILTGLVSLSMGGAATNLQQATRAKDQNENFRLKEETFRLRMRKFVLDRRMMRARLKAEEAKLKLIASKISQVARELERSEGANTLSPEMIQRIQEVYGIVSDVSLSKPDGQELIN
ncbi:MAG TPA: hypothetical protein VMI06_15630 [Terriglobia bacterium]|nr:hypothetical protein [Terriglobia bacterium]